MQPTESQPNDLQNLGAWIKFHSDIREGQVLSIDNNDVAQEERDLWPREDEVPRYHSQAGTGGMLLTYLNQKSQEEPWKPGRTRQ
jgi:hypothetical protein